MKPPWSKSRMWLVRKNYISEQARFHHYPSWYFNQVGETIHIRKIHKSFTLVSTLVRERSQFNVNGQRCVDRRRVLLISCSHVAFNKPDGLYIPRNKHLFRSPRRLHIQGYRFNFMSFQFMYSSRNQPSSNSNINEHTTPKTVTMFVVQAKSFDVKVRVRKWMVHLAFDDHYNVEENFENKGP